jgi:hypothetical protein
MMVVIAIVVIAIRDKKRIFILPLQLRTNFASRSARRRSDIHASHRISNDRLPQSMSWSQPQLSSLSLFLRLRLSARKAACIELVAPDDVVIVQFKCSYCGIFAVYLSWLRNV